MSASTAKFRVFLRALEPEDYKTTIVWRQDEEIWSQLVGRRYFVSAEFERRWVERISVGESTDIKLAICLAADGRHIGNIYATDIDFFNRSAGSAKLIGERDCWGKGYGTEASMLMLRHLFMDLGLERVESLQLTSNAASIRVQQKCGYKTEGLLRRAAMKGGQLVDLSIMACLREDFLVAWERYAKK
jgi:RimJ/RimL family protein N-acetyltransferase